MAILKARVSGSWVDTDQLGMVRLSGSWTEFGPDDPGVDYETVIWTDTTPSLTDAVDGGTEYNMGSEFSLVSAKDCFGVNWRVPDTTPPISTGPTYTATLWDDEIPGDPLASIEFIPTPGVYQDILFEEPVALSSGVNYIVAVYTEHYTFRSQAYPIESVSENIVISRARLVADALAGFPSGNSTTATFYIAPLIGV